MLLLALPLHFTCLKASASTAAALLLLQGQGHPDAALQHLLHAGAWGLCPGRRLYIPDQASVASLRAKLHQQVLKTAISVLAASLTHTLCLRRRCPCTAAPTLRNGPATPTSACLTTAPSRPTASTMAQTCRPVSQVCRSSAGPQGRVGQPPYPATTLAARGLAWCKERALQQVARVQGAAAPLRHVAFCEAQKLELKSWPCADHYHLLGPVPVDLIAGTSDGIIAASDVYTHYLHLREVCRQAGACRVVCLPGRSWP